MVPTIFICIFLWLFSTVVAAFWPVIRAFIKRLTRIGRQATTYIFDGTYIDAKAFYLREFNKPPCVVFVANVDLDKAFEYVSKGNAGEVIAVYQRNYYNWQAERQEFDRTLFQLEGQVMIEMTQGYVEILHGVQKYNYATALMEVLIGFRAGAKEIANQINIISLTMHGLQLKQLEINPVNLDIDLYYNDDFKPIDVIIKDRLSRTNDKGIVLPHGLPGTGKTTYLRHLIASINKKILFVSPGVAGNLMNPEFIDLLIDYPNSVLVIEDAENIIMDRKYSSNSSVSNLLNISDGLLSDCLNVQIICTFNSAINLVDNALMREGRLIAQYEFGKLDVLKAQRLSRHLGFDQKIEKPMSLAEITNPDAATPPPPVQVIGFRRMEELAEN